MMVKELITMLLDMDISKEITVEYPTDKGQIVGNYSRYNESANFTVDEYMHGVVIGVDNERSL